MAAASGGSNKDYPVTRGMLWYFPDACREVARCSKVCNDQHNPGQPMHWARDKSTDHEDCIARHLIASNKDWLDDDGIPHLAKVAWRALALLQTRLEERASPYGHGCAGNAIGDTRKIMAAMPPTKRANPHAAHDQWRDLEMDAESPQVPVAGPAATRCPYADPDEERRRHERAKGGAEPC